MSANRIEPDRFEQTEKIDAIDSDRCLKFGGAAIICAGCPMLKFCELKGAVPQVTGEAIETLSEGDSFGLIGQVEEQGLQPDIAPTELTESGGAVTSAMPSVEMAPETVRVPSYLERLLDDSITVVVADSFAQQRPELESTLEVVAQPFHQVIENNSPKIDEAFVALEKKIPRIVIEPHEGIDRINKAFQERVHNDDLPELIVFPRVDALRSSIELPESIEKLQVETFTVIDVPLSMPIRCPVEAIQVGRDEPARVVEQLVSLPPHSDIKSRPAENVLHSEIASSKKIVTVQDEQYEAVILLLPGIAIEAPLGKVELETDDESDDESSGDDVPPHRGIIVRENNHVERMPARTDGEEEKPLINTNQMPPVDSFDALDPESGLIDAPLDVSSTTSIIQHLASQALRWLDLRQLIFVI